MPVGTVTCTSPRCFRKIVSSKHSEPQEQLGKVGCTHLAQKGFRTKSLVVVTTLLDHEEYPPEEIALLYRRRWEAELNLRSLKIVLQMDHLRRKTPERVRNEFFTHLLGYNLIRGVMALAALQSGKSPWMISFKGSLQTLSQFLPIHYYRGFPAKCGVRHC